MFFWLLTSLVNYIRSLSLVIARAAHVTALHISKNGGDDTPNKPKNPEGGGIFGVELIDIIAKVKPAIRKVQKIATRRLEC